MATKKKKKITAKSENILYLHVDAETKRWLKSLCAKQIGRVSQSTMASRIFAAAKKTQAFAAK